MSAVATNIGTAVVTAVQGIGLVVTPAVVAPPSPAVTLANANVLFRKRPELAPKEEPPKVFVVVGGKPDVERLTGTQKLNKWKCAVVIVTAGGTKLENDDRGRTWIEQIETAVFDQQETTFAGLTGFNRCEVADTGPFDPAALDKSLVWLASNFTVEVITATA